jgi:hypothetical protein
VAPPKRKTGGGRTTPKGTRPGQPAERAVPRVSEEGVAASSRYTPPVPKSAKQSPPWVPVLMFALLAVGGVIVLLYYLGWVPGGRSNVWLVVGLGIMLGGLFTATRYR